MKYQKKVQQIKNFSKRLKDCSSYLIKTRGILIDHLQLIVVSRLNKRYNEKYY